MDSDNDNVVSLGKKRKGKGKTPQSISINDACFEIDPILQGLISPKFKYEFLLVKNKGQGMPIILEADEDGVVSVVDIEYVAGKLMAWAHDAVMNHSLDQYKSLCIVDAAIKVTKSWAVRCARRLEDMPASVLFHSDPGYCFHRVPFDPIPCHYLTSLRWCTDLQKRMTNFDAFAMRVASLFIPEFSRVQAVYLWGDANCGKSSIINVIARLFGSSKSGSFTTLDSDEIRKNNFWKATLIGKRLCVVHEAAPEFIKSNTFKAITGDDYHSINVKNKASMWAKIDTMFIFVTNDEPAVPSDNAVFKRIIPCQMSPIEEELVDSKTYEQELWNEMPALIGYGMELIKRFAKPSGIPCNTDTLREICAEYESEAIDFLHKYFELDPDGYTLASTVLDLTRAIHIHDSKIKKYLKTWNFHFGVTKEREFVSLSIEGVEKRERHYIYKGIRMRTRTADGVSIRTLMRV